jgi:inner membrane protein
VHAWAKHFLIASLEKKAMLWGALAQSIPDIDFLASFWMNTSGNLLAHRGFTHSFLFVAIIAVFFFHCLQNDGIDRIISILKDGCYFSAVLFSFMFLLMHSIIMG